MTIQVDGFFICGATGEWASLEVEEREQVAQVFWKAVSGRLPAIVHVGDCSIRVARRLARHARQAGAFGIAAVPPFYYRISGERSLAGCLAEVAAERGSRASFLLLPCSFVDRRAA